MFAVEVHQASASSSDVSFAAQLSVELPMFGFPTPALGYVWNSSATNLLWSTPGAVLPGSFSSAAPRVWERASYLLGRKPGESVAGSSSAAPVMLATG